MKLLYYPETAEKGRYAPSASIKSRRRKHIYDGEHEGRVNASALGDLDHPLEVVAVRH